MDGDNDNKAAAAPPPRQVRVSIVVGDGICGGGG